MAQASACGLGSAGHLPAVLLTIAIVSTAQAQSFHIVERGGQVTVNRQTGFAQPVPTVYPLSFNGDVASGLIPLNHSQITGTHQYEARLNRAAGAFSISYAATTTFQAVDPGAGASLRRCEFYYNNPQPGHYWEFDLYTTAPPGTWVRKTSCGSSFGATDGPLYCANSAAVFHGVTSNLVEPTWNRLCGTPQVVHFTVSSQSMAVNGTTYYRLDGGIFGGAWHSAASYRAGTPGELHAPVFARAVDNSQSSWEILPMANLVPAVEVATYLPRFGDKTKLPNSMFPVNLPLVLDISLRNNGGAAAGPAQCSIHLQREPPPLQPGAVLLWTGAMPSIAPGGTASREVVLGGGPGGSEYLVTAPLFMPSPADPVRYHGWCHVIITGDSGMAVPELFDNDNVASTPLLLVDPVPPSYVSSLRVSEPTATALMYSMGFSDNWWVLELAGDVGYHRAIEGNDIMSYFDGVAKPAWAYRIQGRVRDDGSGLFAWGTQGHMTSFNPGRFVLPPSGQFGEPSPNSVMPPNWISYAWYWHDNF